MTIDELRDIIEKLDNHTHGICYISIFSDHSGYIHENIYDVRLGEFNNEVEMMELVNNICNPRS